ncbi:MAG: AAA family ATPase [Oscillospiraceae bacterium]
MIINSIDIISFGSFRDFHVSFNKNLNVIHTNVENGKSTIMDFIKMMFYGSPSIDRNSDALSNERLKYRSNNSDCEMGGAINFSLNGKDYILHRIFRNSNNTDIVNLFNTSDNIDEKIPKNNEVGKYLLNLNKQSFKKSVFINQVGVNADDEKVTEVLTNLIKSCDEDISYNVVQDRLNVAKENYLSKSGKIGILDKNKITLASLYEDIETAKQEESKKLQMQIEYQSVQENRDEIMARYDELKRQLSIQNMMEEVNSLKNTVSKFDKINDLNQEIEKRKKALSNENITVDNTFINNAQQKMIALQQIGEHKNQMQSKVYKLKKEIENLKESLENSHQEEHQLHDEATEQIEYTHGHIDNLNNAIEEKKKELAENSEKITNADVEFRVVDEQLKTQKEIAQQRIDIAQQQLEDARKPIVDETSQNSISSFIWLGVIVAILGILIVIFANNMLFLIMAGTGILMTLMSYIERNNAIQKQKNKNRIDEIALSKATENIQKVRYDAEIEQQFLVKKQRETKKQLNLLKLNEEQLLSGIDTLEEQKKILEKNLEYWKNQKLEMEKIFSAEQAKVDKKQSELDNTLDDIANSEKKFTNAQNEIIQYINMFKPCKTLNEVAKAISSLNNDLNQVRDLENKRDYQTESLKAETNGQSYEELREKLTDITADFIEMCGKDNPEPMSISELSALKSEIDSCQYSLNMQSKDLSLINSDIKTNFRNSTCVTEIEHNINSLERTIAKEEQFCRSVDLALEILKLSIDEMKEYTSILNDKTSKIFDQLTEGTSYESLTIAKTFDRASKDDTSLNDWLYLSNGTIEQASMSLRLGISQMVSDTSTVDNLPILLDDTFIQYDDSTLSNGINFLKDYSEQYQTIVFTNHKNVIDIINDTNVNTKVISMSN